MATDSQDQAAPDALGSRPGKLPPGMEKDSGQATAPPIELSLPLPKPPSKDIDQEVYKAWTQHLIEGFERNNNMFGKLLDAFMRPYWLTVRMYQAMFIVGLSGVVLAAVLGVWQGIEFALIFGGLSAASFITFFMSRPLTSLEQNIQFITWLGLIYNTYWTRLMYANNEATIQADLEAILDRSISDIVALLDKQAELAGKRPDLPDNRQ
jgi:hypothetical protein